MVSGCTLVAWKRVERSRETRGVRCGGTGRSIAGRRESAVFGSRGGMRVVEKVWDFGGQREHAPRRTWPPWRRSRRGGRWRPSGCHPVARSGPHPRVLAGTRRAGSMMGVLSSPDPSVEAIFRAGGLAGPTNAPGARETSRSRRRKRDAKLRATVSPARGGATTRAGVLAPSRSARAGTLTSSECSRRTFPRQKYSTWANSLV